MAKERICRPVSLPKDKWEAAAATAIAVNPTNRVRIERLTRVLPDFQPSPMALAVMVAKRWAANGVRLSVGFLDTNDAALKKHILAHMNAWSRYANVKFVLAKTDPDVRIARTANDGYWSYVGTDILHIPKDQPTMNLEAFTLQTPESEYHRVVRHETGHTLGFPHEHMRRDLVLRIDPKKAIKYFRLTQGWSEAEVRAQVLTPLDESQLLGSVHADETSIMCYQLPGEITKDGKPILGGLDIDKTDKSVAASIYPKKLTP
jgi:Astacin (Peptidase family M12A)